MELRKRAWLAILLASAIALGSTGVTSGSEHLGDEFAVLPESAEVQTYEGNLAFPVDMVWQRGTRRIFFTEKDTGRVRIMKKRNLLAAPCVDLDVSSSGERGALGITLHPNFDKNHWLYVYYTNASPLENRVTRFVVKDNKCTKPKHILTGLQTKGATNHNAGQLDFAGNRLMVSTGDAADPSESQNTASLLGKILRLKAGGGTPSGNPFENKVWSYGHRNPFGLAVRPGTKQVFSTENGPNCDDEFNRIRKGRNYGWGPNYACNTNGVGPNPTGPLVRWTPVIVPTDPTWYKGRFKAFSGDVYVGNFSNGDLLRLVMNDAGTSVTEQRVIHNDPAGIVDVTKGPGGWLYFLTSNSIKRIVKR